MLSAFKGVSLIRLPIDIAQMTILMTIIAAAEAGIIRLPVMTPDGQIALTGNPRGMVEEADKTDAPAQVFGFTPTPAEAPAVEAAVETTAEAVTDTDADVVESDPHEG